MADKNLVVNVWIAKQTPIRTNTTYSDVKKSTGADYSLQLLAAMAFKIEISDPGSDGAGLP